MVQRRTRVIRLQFIRDNFHNLVYYAALLGP